jgi:hypothetical protein
MRARLFQASVVLLGTMPLFMASFAACGDDAGNEAFGGGGGASSTATSTTFASAGPGITVTATSTATTSQSSGGDGGAGGEGGASSSDGGGGAGEGGDGGAGGEGGSGPVDQACDNGCVPFPSDGSGGAGGGEDDCDLDNVPNADDCQPCNPDVHPDQEELFGVPYEMFGDEGVTSFDYDCSGVTELEYAYTPDGCSGLPATQSACAGAPIYSGGDAPTCGQTAVVQDCELTASLLEANCTADGPATNMTVRCH